MKTVLSLSAAVVLAAVWAMPAGAAQKSAAGATSATITQDLSARKRHRHYRRYHRGYYVMQPYSYRGHGYGYYGYAADPTAAPYSNLQRMRALGRCVIDLGYGRYRLCS
jgi:hypothetical protein